MHVSLRLLVNDFATGGIWRKKGLSLRKIKAVQLLSISWDEYVFGTSEQACNSSLSQLKQKFVVGLKLLTHAM